MSRHFILLCVLISAFASSVPAVGQSSPSLVHKPGWFWTPPVDCGPIATGLARHSVFHPKNSENSAREQSIHNYLLQRMVKHSGGDAFSVTERGAVWVGRNFQEAYDTTSFHQLLSELPVLDVQVAGDLTMVVSGPEACSEQILERSRKVAVDVTPEWITKLPDDEKYVHATGVSESYYYRTTSWEMAEQHARRNLSATLQSAVQGLHYQENARVSLEIISSDQTVVMQNIQIVSRYHDPRTDLFYVMVRTPL